MNERMYPAPEKIKEKITVAEFERRSNIRKLVQASLNSAAIMPLEVVLRQGHTPLDGIAICKELQSAGYKADYIDATDNALAKIVIKLKGAREGAGNREKDEEVFGKDRRTRIEYE